MGKIFHYAFVVMFTAAVATAVLASLNYATLSRVQEMDKKTQTEARNVALADAKKFDETKVIELDVSDKKIIGGKIKFIPGYDVNNAVVGYVATVNSKGYGAKGIVFVMGIGMDGKVTGLKVTDASQETPGLGYNVTKEDWQKHWKGVDKAYSFNKSIDGFAGATISPEGVYRGVEEALIAFEKVKGGAGNAQENVAGTN